MISRRTLMQATGLTLVGLGSGSGLTLAQVAEPTIDDLHGLIDIHCHIFNASDLPTYGFLRKVLFRVYDEQSVADPNCSDQGATGLSRWGREAAANFCYRLLIKEKAPTAAAELKVLESPVAPAGPPGDQMSDIDAIASNLAAFAPSNDDLAPAGPGPGEADGVDTLFKSGAGERQQKRKAEIRAAIRRGKKEFYEELSREIDTQLLDANGSLDPRPRSDIAPAGPPSSPEDRRQRSRGAASEICSGSGTISRAICWVRKLKSLRSRLATDLQTFDQAHRGKFALYVPLLIDYSAWLENEPESSLQDQVAVMEKISLTATGPKLHGFVAYDPLRDVHSNGKALLLAQNAVEAHGFLGVKTYPPMGFRAWNNTADPPLSFPKPAQWADDGTTIRQLDGPGLARELDRRLGELYKWCAQESVPIITHATNSYGSGPCYSQRANPAFWDPVVKAFPNIRLCLGHFGDFEEAIDGETGKPIGSGKLEDTWEWNFGRVLRNHNPPNAYVDISYFSEVMKSKPDSKLVMALHDAMVRLIGDFPPIAERMIYGTDWLLLAISAHYEEHFEKVYEFMRSVYSTVDPASAGARLQGLFKGNAVRFLGLQAGGRSRKRLEDFYKAKNADAGFLSQF